MNLENYKEQKRDIERQAEKEKTYLLMKFIDLNNPFTVGDIITDHMGSIRYDKLNYTTSGSERGDIPLPIYIGVELKKDGTPKEIPIVREVYGLNVL